jgi:hypothetical protein
MPGDVTISGDFRLSNMDSPFPYVTQFASTPTVVNQLPTGWITNIQGQPPQQLLHRLGHCFDNPPLRL